MLVRPFTWLDLHAVATLCLELGYPATTDEVRRRIESFGPSQYVIVAEDELSKSILGWIEVQVISHVHGARCLEICGLVVASEHRGIGVGSHLVKAAEDLAGKEGLSKVWVRSNIVRDRARGFYSRLGFRLVKTSNLFEKEFSAVQ